MSLAGHDVEIWIEPNLGLGTEDPRKTLMSDARHAERVYLNLRHASKDSVWTRHQWPYVTSVEIAVGLGKAPEATVTLEMPWEIGVEFQKHPLLNMYSRFGIRLTRPYSGSRREFRGLSQIPQVQQSADSFTFTIKVLAIQTAIMGNIGPPPPSGHDYSVQEFNLHDATRYDTIRAVALKCGYKSVKKPSKDDLDEESYKRLLVEKSDPEPADRPRARRRQRPGAFRPYSIIENSLWPFMVRIARDAGVHLKAVSVDDGDAIEFVTGDDTGDVVAVFSRGEGQYGLIDGKWVLPYRSYRSESNMYWLPGMASQVEWSDYVTESKAPVGSDSDKDAETTGGQAGARTGAAAETKQSQPVGGRAESKAAWRSFLRKGDQGHSGIMSTLEIDGAAFDLLGGRVRVLGIGPRFEIDNGYKVHTRTDTVSPEDWATTLELGALGLPATGGSGGVTTDPINTIPGEIGREGFITVKPQALT